MTELLFQGTILTMNPQQPRAEAILVRGENIAFVGNLAVFLKSKDHHSVWVTSLPFISLTRERTKGNVDRPYLRSTLRSLRYLPTGALWCVDNGVQWRSRRQQPAVFL